MKKYYLIILSVLILGAVIIIIVSKQDDTNLILESEPPRQTVHLTDVAIGEIANIDSLLIQVVSILHSEGTSVDIPGKGNEYIIIKVAIKNNRSYPIKYSADDFKATIDKLTINLSIVSGFNTMSSGELVPGGMIDGNLVFEVPSDTLEISLESNTSASYNDSVIFNLSKTIDPFEPLKEGALFESFNIYQLGEKVKLMDSYISVLSTDSTSLMDSKGVRSFLISATVQIENIGYSSQSYRPQFFKICNSKGQVFYPILDSSFSDHALVDGLLQTGESVTGDVIFQYPSDNDIAYLVYDGPQYMGGSYDNIAVFQINH
ncbi:MAG: DUF4352 domain-containing protein [Clostridia bacterium]|nr:DUF4352 domain-containing protein [Clostridia bacterium]